jgi:LPXTG-motif cell wall-anchored protein
VTLPHLPGGPDVQFWWILAIMVTMSGGMLLYFRRKRWI